MRSLGLTNCRNCVLVPVLLAAVIAVGCVAEGQNRKPIAVPNDLQPNLVTIATYPLLDNDNNAYPDTIPIVFYLWDNPYPLPKSASPRPAPPRRPYTHNMFRIFTYNINTNTLR